MENLPIGFQTGNVAQNLQGTGALKREPAAPQEVVPQETFVKSPESHRKTRPKTVKTAAQGDQKPPKKIKVLEVDQWTSTGDITKYSMKNFDLGKVKGGDSEAAKAIFGGHAIIREVTETMTPYIGNVWFITDPKSHKLKFYKANYDSSD